MIRRLTKAEMDAANNRATVATMDDEGIKRMMVTPKWATVIEAMKAGDGAAYDVVERATALFNEGHPVWDPKTKRVVTKRYIDPEGRIYVSSAKSATTNVTKNAPRAQETTMIKSEIAVHSLQELAALVQKGVKPGVKVFMPDPDSDTGYTEVDMDAAEELIARLARESQGSEQMFSPGSHASATNFAAQSGKGPDTPEYVRATPYSNLNPTVTRVGPFTVLSPNADPNIAAPAPFDPSEPGRDPADGAEAVDFTKDTAPIFKSHGAHKVKPGTFRNTMPDQHGRPFGA